MSNRSTNAARDGLRDMFARQGFPLERIGALILGCSMLEHDIEIVLWDLTQWPEPGDQPATDTMPVSERIAEFRKLGRVALRAWPDLPKHVDEFADAAENIFIYRNAVAHGYPIGSLSDGVAGLAISNTAWRGEKRKRKSQTAHLDPPVLDMVLEALYLLLRAIHAGRWQAQDALRLPAMMKSEGLSRAKSLSGEARHLTELMNHEKY